MARKAKPPVEDESDDLEDDTLAAPEPVVPLVQVPGYGEYEIDIGAVMRQKLPEFFDSLAAVRLTEANIKALPSGMKGAYLLFRKDTNIPVYAGKTDAEHGFHDRLTRHFNSVRGRLNLNPDDMYFKAARIMVFSALDVEGILIRRMKELLPGALAWNKSGFGSNDPGRRRDFQLKGLPGGDVALTSFLRSIKQQLPFTFRYATNVPGKVSLSGTPTSGKLRDLMKSVMAALPSGWQTTVLHHRVVLYPSQTDYEFQQEVIKN
jgi:hypothetical protein